MNVILMNILKDWRFWVVVALIVVGIYIYNAGKSKGLGTPPVSVEYPPSVRPQTVSEQGAFQEWAKIDGLRITDAFGDFFSTWRIWDAPLVSLVFECQSLTDNQIIYINNLYNKKYFKQDKGSLVKDLEGYWFPISSVTDFAKKLRKLGAK